MLYAVVVVLVAALIGGVTVAVRGLSGGGAQPEDALPGGAFAFAKVDLDPSAGQKINAMRFLRKFPALRDKVSLNGDLREALFESVSESAGWEKLDFDKDVEPWLGSRVAIAAYPPAEGCGELGGRASSGADSASSAERRGAPVAAVAPSAATLQPGSSARPSARGLRGGVRRDLQPRGLRGGVRRDFNHKVGLNADLRESLFTEMAEGAGWENLSFDTDVAPWLGQRIGIAAYPGARRTLRACSVRRATSSSRCRSPTRRRPERVSTG